MLIKLSNYLNQIKYLNLQKKKKKTGIKTVEIFKYFQILVWISITIGSPKYSIGLGVRFGSGSVLGFSVIKIYEPFGYL